MSIGSLCFKQTLCLNKHSPCRIDSQGYELRILNGARVALSASMFRYIHFEFSPWLMKKSSTGDPMELLELLPSLGALCFDFMGQHNVFPRPGSPLQTYYDSLNGGKNAPPKRVNGYHNDPIGPWEDILGYFPGAKERSVQLNDNAKCTTAADMQQSITEHQVEWGLHETTRHMFSLRRLPEQKHMSVTSWALRCDKSDTASANRSSCDFEMREHTNFAGTDDYLLCRIHTNHSTYDSYVIRHPCTIRFTSLKKAQAACLRRPGCHGVTQDAGVQCPLLTQSVAIWNNMTTAKAKELDNNLGRKAAELAMAQEKTQTPADHDPKEQRQGQRTE